MTQDVAVTDLVASFNNMRDKSLEIVELHAELYEEILTCMRVTDKDLRSLAQYLARNVPELKDREFTLFFNALPFSVYGNNGDIGKPSHTIDEVFRLALIKDRGFSKGDEIFIPAQVIMYYMKDKSVAGLIGKKVSKLIRELPVRVDVDIEEDC